MTKPPLTSWVGRLRQKFTPSPAKEGAFSQAEDAVVYAIGDIHGRLDLLTQLLAMIRADVERRAADRTRLIFLGDYLDRGPQSRGVIDRLSSHDLPCQDCIFLRGNHEQVLLDFLEKADTLASWSQFGGLETLYSYGLRPRLPLAADAAEALRVELASKLPPSHLAFLQATKPFHEGRSHFFVHAGVNPKLPLSQQKPSDLLWIRDEFLDSTRRFEKTIVHGHTPVQAPERFSHRINIDTGAYVTGKLTCLVIAPEGYAFISTGR